MKYTVKDTEVLCINGLNYTAGKVVELTSEQSKNIDKHLIKRQSKKKTKKAESIKTKDPVKPGGSRNVVNK